MDERRQHLRIRRRQKIALFLSDGSTEYMWTVNVSRAGLQAHTPHLVDVGSRFRIATAIFDESRDAYVTIYAKVEVMHKVYDGEFEAYRIGMRFLSFEGKGEAIYTNFVKGLELRL